MSREQFIESYCAASNVSWEWLSKYREVIPCSCGDDMCLGWAMVPIGEARSEGEQI